jgi:hypothetical protein
MENAAKQHHQCWLTKNIINNSSFTAKFVPCNRSFSTTSNIVDFFCIYTYIQSLPQSLRHEKNIYSSSNPPADPNPDYQPLHSASNPPHCSNRSPHSLDQGRGCCEHSAARRRSRHRISTCRLCRRCACGGRCCGRCCC